MSSVASTDVRRGLWRSRWAAVGAAVAVTFGAGGLFAASAASPESSTVAIEPVRILDTRDPVNVGLAGPFVSPVAQDLKVTGSVPTTTGTKTVVPAGATGVFLNVTPVGSTAAGFISVRPANAGGLPSTSNVNFTVGAINPNAVLVELPVGGGDDGKIEITFDAFGAAGPTSDVLVDVVGYTTDTRLKAIETSLATKANSADVNSALATKANAADLAAKANAADSAGFMVNNGTGFFTFTGSDQTVATLALPAGSYVFNAALVANNNDVVVRTVRCSLKLNGTTTISNAVDTFGFFLAPNFAAGERESISMTSAATLASAGTVSLVCDADTTLGNWTNRTITAVKVANLTTSGTGLLEVADPTVSSND